MKILCPFTKLHPRTVEALNLHAPGAWFPYVGGSDFSYLTFLKQMWAEGKATVIVEHDIEVGPETVPGVESCAEPWCVQPFSRLLPGPHSTWDGQGWTNGVPLLTKSLGCVRFSEALMKAEPDLMVEVEGMEDGGVPAGHWRRLDDRIARVLEGRDYRVCVHVPEVKHHHDLRPRFNACSCGDSSCRPAA